MPHTDNKHHPPPSILLFVLLFAFLLPVSHGQSISCSVVVCPTCPPVTTCAACPTPTCPIATCPTLTCPTVTCPTSSCPVCPTPITCTPCANSPVTLPASTVTRTTTVLVPTVVTSTILQPTVMMVTATVIVSVTASVVTAGASVVTSFYTVSSILQAPTTTVSLAPITCPPPCALSNPTDTVPSSGIYNSTSGDLTLSVPAVVGVGAAGAVAMGIVAGLIFFVTRLRRSPRSTNAGPGPAITPGSPSIPDAMQGSYRSSLSGSYTPGSGTHLVRPASNPIPAGQFQGSPQQSDVNYPYGPRDGGQRQSSLYPPLPPPHNHNDQSLQPPSPGYPFYPTENTLHPPRAGGQRVSMLSLPYTPPPNAFPEADMGEYHRVNSYTPSVQHASVCSPRNSYIAGMNATDGGFVQSPRPHSVEAGSIGVDSAGVNSVGVNSVGVNSVGVNSVGADSVVVDAGGMEMGQNRGNN